MYKKQVKKDIFVKHKELSTSLNKMVQGDYEVSPYLTTLLEVNESSTNNCSENSCCMNEYIETLKSTMNKAEPEPIDPLIGQYRRRKGFLFIIALFMLFTICILAFGYIGIIPRYVSIFSYPNGDTTSYICINDPVIGLFNKITNTSISSSTYYNDCFANMANETNIGNVIAIYCLPIALILYVLLTLLIFIIVLCDVSKKGIQKGYVYNKSKFGFLLLLQVLLSFVILLTGFIWNGRGFNQIAKFFVKGTSYIYAGYGLYALIIFPLLSIIFYLCSYKKYKGGKI